MGLVIAHLPDLIFGLGFLAVALIFLVARQERHGTVRELRRHEDGIDFSKELRVKGPLPQYKSYGEPKEVPMGKRRVGL
jgi:hypothetical protein